MARGSGTKKDKPAKALVPFNRNERPELFDERPIEMDGFRFTSRGMEVVGRPGIQKWQTALEFACATHEGSPFWIGELVAYAETRAEWQEKMSQAIAVTRLAQHTLENYGYVARKLSTAAKAIAPSISHAAQVAKMPAADQERWLEHAATEGLTVRELQVEIRQASRRAVIEGQATLEGMYRVVYADYPWPYDDRPPSGVGQEDTYPGMPIDDGLELANKVKAHVVKDAVMFFWVTAPFLGYATDPNQGPDWYRFIRTAGFEPKAQRIWNKGKHGYGHYVSVQHEVLIIATRGSCTPDRLVPMLSSIYTERPSTEHSEKPAQFRKDIERLYDGPYLELFGRTPVDGWTVFGNDARLWAGEAAAQATPEPVNGEGEQTTEVQAKGADYRAET